MAFKNAFRKGSPIMLEPVMKIEIVVQDEYLGDVMIRFQLPPGRVTHDGPEKRSARDRRPGAAVTDVRICHGLRTLTQGRGNYSLEFLDYSEMSEGKMNEVLKSQLGIYTINFRRTAWRKRSLIVRSRI